MESNVIQNKDRKKKTAFAVIVALLFCLRFVLSNRLPAYIISESPHDDLWMVQRAIYFLQGQWMGQYDHYTLIKGVFSPLLFAFTTGLGISFQGLNTVLYCFSCLVFMMAVRPLLKKRWMQIVVLIILLFNPIPYALQTGQRIYRNGISQWQILLIFASILALFIRRKEVGKKLLPWALLGGAALGAFLNTREDGIWIYPFILVALAVTIILSLVNKELTLKKTAVFVLPIVLALAANMAVSTMNYIYYGAFLRNDRDGGNYAKVMQDLYLIEPNAQEDALYQSEEYQSQYYNVYASTVEKAFEASPTFQSIAQPVRDAIVRWDSWDSLVDGEPYADHILFAIRDGVAAAGYYNSLPEAEAFYGTVHQELQAAFNDGTLQKRGISISAMAAPVQEGDIAKTFALLPQTLRSVITFEGVSAEVVPASGTSGGIEKFRLLSGSDYFLAPGGDLICSGWAFAYDDGMKLTATVCSADGNPIAAVPLQGGKDVYDSFAAQGNVYTNAENCRYAFSLAGYDLTSGLKLCFTDAAGAVFREIPLDGTTFGGSDGQFHYAVDQLTTQSDDEMAVSFYSKFTARANWVIRKYQTIGELLAWVSLLCYLVVTVLWVLDIRRKQADRLLALWLGLTGIGLSLILFLLCICYMTATTFFAGHYLYLSSAYVLFLMFCALAIFGLCSAIIDRRKPKKEENNE